MWRRYVWPVLGCNQVLTGSLEFFATTISGERTHLVVRQSWTSAPDGLPYGVYSSDIEEMQWFAIGTVTSETCPGRSSR